MKNKRAPHFRVVKFLKDLIDEWDPSEVSSEEFRDQVREAILGRQLAITTASNYLTAVKRGCMRVDKAVDPLFLEDFQIEIVHKKGLFFQNGLKGRRNCSESGRSP